MNYLQLRFKTDNTQREILIAQLSAAGFHAFEEEGDDCLIAGIAQADYDADAVAAIARQAGATFTTEILLPTNWNTTWESSFQPVAVEGFCTVRAAFHPPATETPYEIIVTPKMSFGTGHHATTRLIMEAMRSLDFRGKHVLDFGTGTGILAILAAKLGAESVVAIDNDEWSVTNAEENIAANGTTDIRILHGSLEAAGSAAFDIILANINRHILLQYMPLFPATLRPGGTLLLSGILTADEAVILPAAKNEGFVHQKTLDGSGWLAIVFCL